MADISASAVASLRARTGVSILECKKVLEEAGGDEEAAIELLRKRGAMQAAKKSDREQSEGLVFVHVDGGKAGILFLRCETDFVARDENFQKLGAELAETLAKEGGEATKTIAESKLSDAVQKLGENISIGDAVVVEENVIGSYVHTNGKIGVVVGMDGGSEEIARDIAMHAAAMNPLYVSPEDVPEEEVEKERTIWKDQLAKEGKPEEIMEKIMMGKEKKFREENALLTQEFVKEPGKTVQEHAGESAVTSYVRIAVG